MTVITFFILVLIAVVSVVFEDFINTKLEQFKKCSRYKEFLKAKERQQK